MFKSPRTLFALGAVFAFGTLGYAYFAQYVQGYDPCPLCILQRVAMAATGLVMLIAALHGPGRAGRAVYGALAAIVALVGAGIAGRHVWLQQLPSDRIPDCGPGLEYMLEVFPLWEALEMAIRGSGECTEIDWSLLGLSMPGWVLLCFVGLAVFGVWNGCRSDAMRRDGRGA